MRVSPSNILLFATLIIVAIGVIAGNFVVRQPYLGAGFKPGVDQNGVVVDWIDDAGPAAAAGLRLGDTITAIDSQAAARTEIFSSIGLIDPDSLARLADFEAFLVKNGEIHRHFKADAVILERADGTRFDVTPRSVWPFYALWTNSEFVGALGIASASFLLGIMLWMHSRSESVATRFLLLASLANALTLWSASLFWTRELALPETAFRLIMAANHLGAVFYPVSIVALIAVYPKRLLSRVPIALWLICAVIYWTNQQTMLVDLPVHNFMSWYVLCMAICVIGILLQWRATRVFPVQRAQIIWLSLCIMLMSLAMLVYHIVPMMFFEGSLGDRQWVAGLLTFFPFAGFALGISRYRLFDLPEWWFNAWVLVLTGVIIVIAEVALIFLLGFHHIKSLAYAGLALGWIYFPLRNRLFGYVFRSPELSAEAVLPTYVSRLARAKTIREFNQCLHDELGRLFSPSSLTRLSTEASTVSIGDDGMTMTVPGAVPGGSFRLEAAAKATRLFNRRDAALAATLSQITNRHCLQIEAIETGIDRERGRIARDLHDTVGAKLVGLLHQSSDKDVSHRIREVNSAVKDTIWLLRSKDAESLSYALSKWSEETRLRLDEKEIALEWREEIPSEFHLPAHDIVSMGNILREAITNILKHSAASRVRIAISLVSNDCINIAISNDGTYRSPDEWTKGFGLLGLNERLNELDGQLDWQCDLLGEGMITMVLAIPLRVQEKGSG